MSRLCLCQTQLRNLTVEHVHLIKMQCMAHIMFALQPEACAVNHSCACPVPQASEDSCRTPSNADDTYSTMHLHLTHSIWLLACDAPHLIYSAGLQTGSSLCRLRLCWDRVLDPAAMHVHLDKRVRGAQANVDLSHLTTAESSPKSAPGSEPHGEDGNSSGPDSGDKVSPS